MGTTGGTYDPLARIYNENWAYFADQVLPIVDTLVLEHLPPGADILDICCGPGHLAALLIKAGYRVTGIDSSSAMIELARKNAPAGEFAVQDVRTLQASQKFDAALSTFDSLNHLMTPDDLEAAFQNVFAALRERARFLFDLNMEEGFRARWRGSIGISRDDYACILRPSYRPEERLGRYDITTFLPTGPAWQRRDFTITERCYADYEIRSLLDRAGFADVEEHDARTFGWAEIGRSFFVCRRP